MVTLTRGRSGQPGTFVGIEHRDHRCCGTRWRGEYSLRLEEHVHIVLYGCTVVCCVVDISLGCVRACVLDCVVRAGGGWRRRYDARRGASPEWF